MDEKNNPSADSEQAAASAAQAELASEDKEMQATGVQAKEGVNGAAETTENEPEDDASDDDVIDLSSDDDDDDESVIASDEGVTVEDFNELDLEDDLKNAVSKLGWSKPTPVQGKCLPFTLVGKDVAGFAQTGTGKTGVFLITLANTIVRAKANQIKGQPRAIILVPTRELAVQIHSDAKPIFDDLDISSLAVYGGVDYDKQAQAIRSGVDVIVATPGRLKDYYQKKIFNLKSCNQFVVDEADRMFDMGFVEDLEYFLERMGDKPQKLLFSATTNDDVKELAFEYLETPEYISINPEVMTPERIEQFAIICESTQKLQVMLGLLREHNPACSVIFTNTKIVAEWLHYKLQGNGIDVELITGDLPQRKRINLINRIKKGEIKALIATDVASRGLHISGITHVYNFDLPNEASNYVHRIGRTARAGAKGRSYSLICEDYGHNLQAITDYLGDQVSIDITWFDESYLTIEDKAKNPYTDPEFKGNTVKAESSDRSSDRGPGRRGGQKRSGAQRADEASPNRDGAKDSRQRPKRKRRRKQEPGMEGSPQQAGERSTQQGRGPRQRRSGQKDERPFGGKGRHDRSNKKTQRPPQSGRRPHQPEAAAAAQQESPKSIGGLFKRFVSLMFGKKD